MADFLSDGGLLASRKLNSRPPIFMVHGETGYTMPKPLFFEGLAADQELVLLQIPGLSGDRPIPGDVPKIAEAYVDQIEQSWPEGRVHIGAFCNGALIALEMSSQLAMRGRSVDHMVLLDPTLPKSIEAVHRGRAVNPIIRAAYFLFTGRLSGGASKSDLPNRRIRKLRARFYYLSNHIKKLRTQLTGHRASRFRAGQNIWATSQLRAAINHYWPEVYSGKVDLICARQRLILHEDPTSFWRIIMPHMKVWGILEKHEEVTGATSSEPAEKMQLLFDQSENRQA